MTKAQRLADAETSIDNLTYAIEVLVADGARDEVQRPYREALADALALAAKLLEGRAR